MRKEIPSVLTALDIQERDIRKEKGLKISFVLILAVIFFIVPFFDTQLNALFGLDVLIIIFGGLYLLYAIPIFIHPLEIQYRAFKNIAHAVKYIEDSNTSAAYREAYKYTKKACDILEKPNYSNLGWYAGVNQTLGNFFQNMRLIVLPAIANATIKKEHLEDIAIALANANPSAIDKVNETLVAEQTYSKLTPEKPQDLGVLFRKFMLESKIGMISTSLVLGYFLILVICLFFTAILGMDFALFARTNPAIIIGGGLTISGIILLLLRTK
jgi:hypothetical protein